MASTSFCSGCAWSFPVAFGRWLHHGSSFRFSKYAKTKTAACGIASRSPLHRTSGGGLACRSSHAGCSPPPSDTPSSCCPSYPGTILEVVVVQVLSLIVWVPCTENQQALAERDGDGNALIFVPGVIIMASLRVLHAAWVVRAFLSYSKTVQQMTSGTIIRAIIKAEIKKNKQRSVRQQAHRHEDETTPHRRPASPVPPLSSST